MKKNDEQIETKTYQITGVPVSLIREIGIVRQLTLSKSVAILLEEMFREYIKVHRIKIPEQK